MAVANCTPITGDKVECLHVLTNALGGKLNACQKFNFDVQKGRLSQADGNETVRHLYACGCTTSQICKIIPISKCRAIRIRFEMVRDGYHIRGKGQSPLLNRLDVHKSIRLDLLVTLCAYTMQVLGADDLQAVISGTYVYFDICQKTGINSDIDAAMLYQLYQLHRYTIRKCVKSVCSSLFVGDREETRPKNHCWHCSNPSHRLFTEYDRSNG